jgi:hypothetical protein
MLKPLFRQIAGIQLTRKSAVFMPVPKQALAKQIGLTLSVAKNKMSYSK